MAVFSTGWFIRKTSAEIFQAPGFAGDDAFFENLIQKAKNPEKVLDFRLRD
jgi:hypothetical protein